MKLSITERWILSNQFEILKNIDPKNKRIYEPAQEVIERGYETAYPWYCQHIHKEVVSEDVCNEVLDVLGMFDILLTSYSKLSSPNTVTAQDVEFPGFSGNDEASHMAFTRFLINVEGKWPNLHRGDDFNSHIPLLSQYRSMLSVFNSLCTPKRLLSESEIKSVLDAGE